MPPEQSLLSGAEGSPPPEGIEPITEQTPPVTPAAQEAARFQTPEVTPPVEEVTPPVEGEITEEIRAKVIEQLREGVPAEPTGYELPDLFEGQTFENDEAKAAAIKEVVESPLIQMLQKGAHEAGMKPEAFQTLVKDYFAEEKRLSDEATAAERTQLGRDEAAITTRVNNLVGVVQRLLPADEAKALIGMATTAAGVRALEKLVNRTGAPPTNVVPAQQDDWPTIESLMNSDKYMGHQPDPATVARVTRYFESGGRRGGR